MNATQWVAFQDELEKIAVAVEGMSSQINPAPKVLDVAKDVGKAGFKAFGQGLSAIKSSVLSAGSTLGTHVSKNVTSANPNIQEAKPMTPALRLAKEKRQQKRRAAQFQNITGPLGN